MDRLANWVSRLFGWCLLFLSGFVTVEVLTRKIFNASLQGADELGGYVLAFSASAAFIVAMIDRAHIRIDLFHERMPVKLQAVVDWISVLTLGLLGIFFLYIGWFVIRDTMAYGSTAPTPWATPLIWPQSLWYLGLSVFALCALIMCARATSLFLAGQFEQLASEFNPKSATEELSEELDQMKER